MLSSVGSWSHRVRGLWMAAPGHLETRQYLQLPPTPDLLTAASPLPPDRRTGAAWFRLNLDIFQTDNR